MTKNDVGSPALELSNVVGRIGGATIIDHLSLTVPQGGLLSIIGPNGAGKTTLFRLISGLLPVVSGQIRLAGQRIERRPAHVRQTLGLGVAMQNPALLRDYSVFDNFRLARLSRRWKANRQFLGVASQDELTQLVLDRIGLWSNRHRAVSSLSHGYRKWLEVGLAVAQSPEVLLLDEPVAGLTDNQVEKMVSLISSVREFAGVVVIEHRERFLERIDGNVCVLSDGNVLYQGSFQECWSSQSVRRAYFGESDNE